MLMDRLLSKIISDKINLFYFGVVLFLFGIILSLIIDPKVAQFYQSFALIILFGCGISVFDFRCGSKYFKLTLFSLLLWHAFIFLKAESFSYNVIKDYLFSDFRFWPYVFPIVALFVNSKFIFKKTFHWLFLLGLFSIPFVVFTWQFLKNIPATEVSIGVFSSGCGFLLLTWSYHNKWKKAVALISLIFGFYVATLLARRNVMLTNANFILFAYLLYIFFTKGNITTKLLSIYGVLIVMIGGLFFFQENKDTDFKLIANRIAEDTRENVFANYFEDMKGNMLLGKGIDGQYYCPMVTEDEVFIYRDLIECGYLQVILKGGIVNLVLLLLIMIPAIFLGLFRSRNLFAKASAIVILLWLVDMFPYGLPSFSMRYFLVWICIGVCFSKQIRQMNEVQIKSFIGSSSIT